MLHTYRNIRYTSNEDEVLRPYQDVLSRIFSGTLSEVERFQIPAIVHVAKTQAALEAATATKKKKKPEKSGRGSKAVEAFIKAGHVMEAGDLSLTEQNRAANWIFHNIPGASKKGQELKWLGKPTLAHAYTIMLARKHWQTIRDKLKLKQSNVLDVNSDPPSLQKVWRQAFALQLTARNDTVETVDVDKECISDFERRLFELSERSGPRRESTMGS